MKRILGVLAVLCPFLVACQGITLQGKVINEEGEPVAGATIILKGQPRTTVSDHRGLFTMAETSLFDTLRVSAVGYEPQEVPNNERGQHTIILQRKISSLQEVTVSTGYQSLSRERATGSFDLVENNLLNRRVSSSLLDRIENATPGLFLNRADNQQPNTITIRGRSTIFANAAPLIVLDNFPYDGDLAAINPADIESVTVLKDAAAASIWGARAGNGVMVITTKKGRTFRPQVSFGSALTLTEKPSLFDLPVISSADYIELEKFLYSKGFYAAAASHPGRPPLTPTVELLMAKTAGTISAAEADAQIEALKANDVRRDIGRYFYRLGAEQQYNLGFSGSTPVHQYYLSAGFDAARSHEVGTGNNRFSLRSSNSFKLHPRLDLQAALAFTRRGTEAGNNPGYGLSNGAGKSLYPYARLVNDEREPVPLLRDYRTSFASGGTAAGLLNWTYTPLEDIALTENRDRISDYLLSTGLVFRMAPALTAEMRYQYEASAASSQVLYGSESYYARNLVNQFTQVDTSGILTRPVPVGGVLQRSDRELQSQQGRAQLSFRQTWGRHQLSAIGGGEVKDRRTTSRSVTLYGYNEAASAVVTNMDFATRFRRYDNPNLTANIPNSQSISGNTDRFVSYFVNAGYTFKGRYYLSGSARKEASNLFGVRTNQKGVPLWSAGVRWDVHSEGFYPLAFLPRLSLRATYGYAGNIARNTSAYTTASYSLSPATGALMATINNPPNEALRWEKNRTLNLGLDFALKGQRLSGSLEWYRRKATDLMGRAPIDGTVGLAGNAGGSTFFGNIASMEGRGWDLRLEALPIDGAFKWNTTLLLSRVYTEVTGYDMPVSAVGNSYLSESFVSPLVGRPLFSVFAFRWGGLDGSGNPVGYVNGQPATDYASLVNKTPLDSLVFKGSINPVVFGAWRHTLSWRQLSLSWVVSFKGNYWFRRPSVNYSELFNTWSGHADYALRWQKPGDEMHTAVPALAYPANSNRDRFYNFSEVLVERGDHLRLEDVGLAYELEKARFAWLPFQRLRLSVVATGLGTLWVANKAGLDPYYTSSLWPGHSFSFGINLQL